MQSSRVPDGERVKPEIYLRAGEFDFVKKLQVGDKGDLEISGVLTRVRKTEDGYLFKTFEVLSATPKMFKQARQL